MKKKLILKMFLIIFILFFSILQVMPVKAQAPQFSVVQTYWGSEIEKIQAKPGDNNASFNVVIQNTDTGDMNNVTAKLPLTGFPFTTPTGEKEAYAGYTRISPGEKATLTFTLNIDGDAELGVYKISMEVNSTTTRYASGVTSSVFVSVQLFGEVRFSTKINPETILPGSNYVNLTLTNDGMASASNVNVEVDVPSPLVIVAEDSHWSFPEVQTSRNVTIPIQLYAPTNSAGNAYPITIRISYDDGYGFGREDLTSLGLIVENPTVKPVLNFEVDKKEILAGKEDVLNITILNEGSVYVVDLNVTLNLPQITGSSPLILIKKDNFWHFDLVRSKSSTSFPVYITTEKGVVGTYQFELALTYRDTRGESYSETRSSGLTVSLQTASSLVNIESYSVKPEAIYQGDVFILTLNIKNFGDFEAQAVTVELSTPNLFAPISPSLINLGTLAPNSNKQGEYMLMVSPSAEEGVVYVFTININYVDSTGVKQVTKNFLGVPLHGTIEFVVYDVSTLPSPTHIGMEFTVSFTILNRGTTTAKYTTITLIPDFPFQPTGEESPYIGPVDPDAPTPLSLTAVVSQNVEEGVYPLKISIYYMDEYNKPHTFTHEIPIKVVSPPQVEVTHQTTGSEYILPIVVVAIILVGSVLSVILIRRKHKPSPLG